MYGRTRIFKSKFKLRVINEGRTYCQLPISKIFSNRSNHDFIQVISWKEEVSIKVVRFNFYVNMIKLTIKGNKGMTLEDVLPAETFMLRGEYSTYDDKRRIYRND